MTPAAQSITAGPSRPGLLEGPVGRGEAVRFPKPTTLHGETAKTAQGVSPSPPAMNAPSSPLRAVADVYAHRALLKHGGAGTRCRR